MFIRRDKQTKRPDDFINTVTKMSQNCHNFERFYASGMSRTAILFVIYSLMGADIARTVIFGKVLISFALKDI